MILWRRGNGIRSNPLIFSPREADWIVDFQLLVELVGITLAFIRDDPLSEYFTFLIAKGHEHTFPVFKIQIHPFLDGQVDRCSDLAKKEVTQNSLFRMNP